ncbi:MAG: response regulator [Lachnospiraceae bacterium]|nr:response regulator [Lachnospiraceae bacterium]
MGNKTLIIDENLTERLFIKRLLEKAGVFVMEAKSKENAVLKCREEEFDFIIVDSIISGNPGMDLLVQIHEDNNGVNSDTPSILLCEDDPFEYSFDEHGYVKGVIGKPVTLSKLQLYFNSGKRYYIDEDLGCKYCNGKTGFDEAIAIYFNTAKKKLPDIKKHYEEEDWDNYIIKVHSLKSSSRTIGAIELGKLAEQLEHAGKAKDFTIINENQDRLLEFYKEVVDEIEERYLSDPGNNKDAEEVDKKEVTEEILNKIYDDMRMYVRSADLGMMESSIQEIREYKLSPEETEKINKIESDLMEMNWKGIKEILK